MTFLSLAVVGFSAAARSQNSELEPVEIQLIRNATLKIQYNDKLFLVDPSLSPKNSFMSFVVPDKNLNPTVDLPMSIEEVTNDVDAVLLTHAHPDHFDEAGRSAFDPAIPFFGQPFDQKVLEESPYTNVSLVEEKTVYEGTTIIRTEGKHGPDELLENLGGSSGYVLQAEGYPTVFIIGDCLWDEDIQKAIELYQPEIIVANTGGASWGGAKILMDENSVVELAKFAPKATIVAVHMEALDHCTTTREMVAKKAKEEGVRILTPKDGEIMRF